MRTVGWLALLVVVGCGPGAPIAGPRAAPADAGSPARDAGAPVEVDASIDVLPDAPVVATRLPGPVIGGGLLITGDGATAVVSDPDRDVIHLVSLGAARVRARVALAPHEEPGRAVEDGGGIVHVVLRGAGAILSIDPASGSVLARRPVCAAPRGIAWRASDDTLHVACAEGWLVTLDATGAERARARLDLDLRDVVIVPGARVVSRFRAAELLFVDDAGAITSRVRMPGATVPSEGLPVSGDLAELEAAIAWRVVATETVLVVLHQRHLITPIVLAEAPMREGGAYGGGGGGLLGGMVQSAITEISLVDGSIRSGTLGRPLVVDLAVANGAAAYAMVGLASTAGLPRGGTDQPRGAFTLARSLVGREPLRALVGIDVAHGADQSAAAIAFAPDAEAWALALDPLRLVSHDHEVVLGEGAADPGRDLFYEITPSGLACASCHPEGGDDGHVWTFADVGPRRTQALGPHVVETAPFHWSGDLRNLETLVTEVMQRRMGAPFAPASDVVALGEFLARLPVPRAPDADDGAVARGRAIFERADVGCATCHAGEAYGGTATADVGTGEALQVPSLRSVAYRTPLMHDGCAPDLRARFTDTVCGGGDRHGQTSHLAETEIDDLVAFLSSL